MEQTILEAEQRVDELEALSRAPETLADPERMHTVYARLKEAQDAVEALYARWSELEEKAP
jgi:ATP-binding cassette subfamily F protein uup